MNEPPQKSPPQRLGIAVHWVARNEHSWLAQQFRGAMVELQDTAYSGRIESLAQETHRLGAQPLWKGYAGNNIGGPTRLPNEVRTAAALGNLYTRLVQARRPEIIVEFGTAFGVSGMYFLAGLEANGAGKLLTFEPNDVWSGLARGNLSKISDRYQLVAGTFEENIDAALPRGQRIDMAFIDAIHTREFVLPQLELVVARASSKAIIILDDIHFSRSMAECWKEVSNDTRFSASLALGNRVGVLELGS